MATNVIQTAVDGTIDIDIGATAGVSGVPLIPTGTDGDLVVVPKADIAINTVGAVYVSGVVVRHTKVTGDTIVAGEIAYFENSAAEFSNASSGNTKCGFFVRDATGAGTADVYLSQ